MKTIVFVKLLIYNVLYKNIFGIFYHFYDVNFNKTACRQRNDYTNIPFIINNFNQLFYLRQLIVFLRNHNFRNIIIIDNKSTYPPLLDYYNVLEKTQEVTIYKLNSNLGHRALYTQKAIMRKYCKGYYFLSDADCLPYPDLPSDFTGKMIDLIDKYYLRVSKVGLALNLDDIPYHYTLKDKVLNWEQKFWQNEVEPDVYEAPVDTTFALYKPAYGLRFVRSPFLSGLRLAGKYKIKHGGWYENSQNPSAEHTYYKNSASAVGSWVHKGLNNCS